MNREMATRREVAKLAGVSEATVSRVLNGVGPIKESTRQRVLEAAKTLDYQLNAVAASFARGRSGNIGVVLPHVPNVRLFYTYYFSEILSGIGEAARSRGQGLLLLYREPGAAYDYASLFHTQRVDVCVLLGTSSLPKEREGIERLAKLDLPFCVVDQRFEDPRVPAVFAEHVEGTLEATRHLLGMGHRRIGFLNGSPYYSNSQDRAVGYRKALAEAGIPLNPELLYEGNYSRKSGFEAASRIYRDLASLDAVLCANDRMAIGLIQGLREQGCRLPRDLPIVGYDDSDAAALFDPPLTTVQVPFYEMGRIAAENLLRRLAGESGDVDSEKGDSLVMLPTKLIVRKSSQSGEE